MDSTRIEAIVERSATDIVKYPIVKATVRRDGARTIDTADITLAGGAVVDLDDKVSYIQDDVPLTNLLAIWNFQGSYRDESGFHHDGTRTSPTNPDEGFVVPNEQTNTLKYRGNYGLNFTATGQKVTVADKNMASDKTNASLDFRGQFDIIINFKNNANPDLSGFNSSPMILFSKYDTTNSRGVEIGLKVVSSQWVVYAKLDATEFIGDKTLYDINTIVGLINHANTGATRMIRFYRNEKGVVRLLLDNQIDYTSGTASESTKSVQTVEPSIEDDDTDSDFGDYLYARTTDVAYIGAGRSSNTDFNGHIFQIRVYCGGYLQDDDVEILMSAGAQQMTQKVSGIVWEREDKLDKIKLSIKSRARTLLETNLTNEIISDNTQAGEATHTRNVFDGGQESSLILKTIVNKVDSDFVFFRHKNNDSGNTTHADGKFMATGTFIKSVDLLMIYHRKGFLTFPTKTFVWEYGAHEGSNMGTGLTFSDEEYQIYERAETDLGIINDLEIYGDVQLGHAETNFGKLSDITADQAAPNNSSPILFVAPPLNLSLKFGTEKGIVHSISVTDKGSGISSTPSVLITGASNTRNATATATVSSGSISKIVMTDHGKGFAIDDPPNITVSGAVAVAHVTTGGATGAVIEKSHYWVDFNTKKLYFNEVTWSGSTPSPDNYVWARYDYEIKADTSLTLGGNANAKRHWLSDPTDTQEEGSILKYGVRSARWYLPQLLYYQDFNSIGQKIIDEFCGKEANGSTDNDKRRYTIKAPFLINSVRENLHVTIKSTVMKPKGSNNDGELLLPVKSIEWEYPACITTIDVGDYNYNIYDILKTTSDTASSMVGSILKTRG